MNTWDSDKPKKKIGILFIIFMQLSVIIYTMSGVCGKLASKYEVMSMGFIGMYVLDVAILGIYAILWQQIIKRIDLSIAYANKGTSLLWSLVWSLVFFHEGDSLTINNIIGILVVMVGIVLVNMSGDSKKEQKEDKES